MKHVGLVFLALAVSHAQPQASPSNTPENAPYADSFPGKDIGEKTNAAFARCRPMPGSCLVKLTPNRTYQLSTTIRIPPTSATLDCSGSTLRFIGTGDAVFVASGPPEPPFLSGGIRDCTILGSPAERSNGIHQQSRVGFMYDGVAVRGFTGPESSAIWWENVAGSRTSPGWNEQNVVRKMDLGNSTKLFRLSRNGGTDSFAYNRFDDLHMDVMDGQVGLSIEGTGASASVSLIHSDISIRANVNANAKSASVIAVTRGGRVEASRLTLRAEQTSGSAESYGLYVDKGSMIYASGAYSAANLKIFSGGTLVMVPTLNPATGSVHFEPAQDVIQQRHCKFDLGPRSATFWLASYGAAEVDCNFKVLARNTDDANPEVDVPGKGAEPVNVIYADGKTKSVGIGPGFSDTSLPAATLSVNGTVQLGVMGTSISKLAKYEPRLSPASVAPGVCMPQRFQIAGIEAGDVVLAVNPPRSQEGLAIGSFDVPSAGAISVTFCNLSGSPLTPSADGPYRVVVVR